MQRFHDSALEVRILPNLLIHEEIQHKYRVVRKFDVEKHAVPPVNNRCEKSVLDVLFEDIIAHITEPLYLTAYNDAIKCSAVAFLYAAAFY